MIKNPVLTGFHPDPSMINVDGTFYIANSTFEYFPGVKISKSKDLANWETVGYPLDSKRMMNLKGVPKSAGIWAPCLSYSDGTFYLVYTVVRNWSKYPFKDTPNYITTAKSIEGPWSDPVYMNSMGFDTSLFHDDDGRKYFLNMEWDYRKPEPSPQFSGIYLTEIDAKTFAPISDIKKVFSGTPRGLVEGPHIYKRNGYYYLLCAEGGTSYEHAESVARSKNIWGPYEVHPNELLISTLDAPDSYIKKTGHGSLCEDTNGRWWFAFLCGRPVDETMRCPLGRETSINEIVWEDDWPYLKNKTIVPDSEFEGYGEKLSDVKVDYVFGSDQFYKDFNGLRHMPKHEIVEGKLRLSGGDTLFSTFEQNVLLKRQQHFSFEVETCVNVPFDHFMKMGGLIYRYDEYNQYLLRVSYNEEISKKTLGILMYDNGEFDRPLGENEILLEQEEVYLKLSVDNRYGKFSYSYDGLDYTDIDYTIDVSKLSDEYTDPMGFTGAFVGMSAIDTFDKSSYTEFKSFSYNPISE